MPLALWFAGYALVLRYFVPRVRVRSRRMSEARSTLTGRVVDSYTNILTVKLFARPRDEDAFVRDVGGRPHRRVPRPARACITLFGIVAHFINAAMIVGTGAIGVLAVDARQHLRRRAGDGAAARPGRSPTWRAGWRKTSPAIFENVGVVQDGMRSIAVPRQMPDPPDAAELRVHRGARRVRGLRFGYGTARGVLHGIDLAIAPGERVGLVGPSGAGKSTLVNLLLRFYAARGRRAS